MSDLGKFLLFYGALFAAFGVASPFLPGLLQQNGLTSGELGVVLAAGTAVRLLAGPLGCRVADLVGRAPLVLAGFAAASAAIALGYGPARGVAMLLLISVAHASVLAPLTPVADALALGSAKRGQFQYGWVRGAGSAAFILGTLLSGQLVDDLGLGVIIWLNAALLAVAAGVGWALPNRVAGAGEAVNLARTEKRIGVRSGTALRTLLRLPMFARLMIVAALIGGSHALHDSFEVIRWRMAGLSAAQSSFLWSLSVAAEVVVFVAVGPALLARLGPSKAMLLAASAGIVRWSTAAVTAWFPAMVLVEPLHGLTFALLHLACMDVIAKIVPISMAATAQAVYATLAVGAMAAIVTLASGPLYSSFGASSFWAMAGLCALALPFAARLRP